MNVQPIHMYQYVQLVKDVLVIKQDLNAYALQAVKNDGGQCEDTFINMIYFKF